MKKIFSITILTIAIALGSCKKFVDEQPISEGLLNSFYTSKLDADAAIAGMYGELQATMVNSGGQYNNRMTWWGEARSDNWERRLAYATASNNEIDFNGLTATNAYADWYYLYSCISRANLLIQRLPLIKNYQVPGSATALSDALEASYTAQSYAMRALCYFWIARVWGSAPLRTEPYTDATQSAAQAKNTQDEILAQCISDLQKAYDLTVKGQTPTVFYLGEGAICSIMADIYMWKKDYPNAIIWFKRLFAAKAPTGKIYNAAGVTTTGSGGAIGDLQPGNTWTAQFAAPAGSNESIFNIHWDAVANGCACMAGISKTTNEPLIRMADPLWTNWPTLNVATYGTTTATVDLRVKQTYNTSSATNQPIRDRSFWKFYAGTVVAATATAGYTYTSTGYGGQVANVPATDQTNIYMPLYRLGGMYLLYAEALNWADDPVDAVKYLNLIKTRAGIGTVTVGQFADKLALEKEIIQERQYELLGEGVRWFDLVRTDRVKEVMDPILIARQAAAGSTQTGWGTDKRRYYWPIASSVLFANPLLVQNPVYAGQ